MRVSREQSKINYKEFVEEMYQLTHKRPTEVSVSKLCKKHQVSPMVSVVLQERGILKRGRLNIYRWVGAAPYDQMVTEVRDVVMTYHKNIPSKNSHKNPNQLELAPETKPHIERAPTMKAKKTRTFSFLWGAIKFNY